MTSIGISGCFRLESVDALPRNTHGVEEELLHPSAPAATRHWLTAKPAWLEVRNLLHSRELNLVRQLDRGECEAIQLAMDLHADFLLIDERRGRTMATERGIIVVGILGTRSSQLDGIGESTTKITPLCNVGEFLITTLPVTSLDTTSTSSSAVVFPHYADGGGWTSAVVLINPTDSSISGTAQFYSKGTTTTPGVPINLSANGSSANTFSYMIPPRSAFKLQTTGFGAAVQTGWVKVTPSSGNLAPAGLVVFSFDSIGVRVSEAGVPALPGSSTFRMYTEASSSIQTGIAVSNPGSSNITVDFDLTNLDGTPTGITGAATVPASGQIAMFLNQISGFSALPTTFKGVLRISGGNVFVTGLRGRYNERGDFLITTTIPVDEMSSPPTSELLFPQLADGGGYTTQFILFSGTAGQSATGTLQFVSQGGQPLKLTLQ